MRPRPPRKQASVMLRGLTPHAVGRLKWRLRLVRLALDVARRRATLPFGWRVSGALLRRGFLPQSQVVYELDRNDARDYVSDRQRELTWAVNWPEAGLLDDKLAFFFMLDHAGIPTPEVLGVVVEGRVRPLGRVDTEQAAQTWLPDRLARSGRLVVKPVRSGGGQGILMLEHGGGVYRLNGEPIGWPALERRLADADDCIVCEYVEQGAYAHAIFPRSPNSLRLLTMVDDREEPFVAAAAHRFGTDRSAPVDNWSRGGVSARVDSATGTLGCAVGLPRGGDGVRRHARHPDTGAQIEGVRVPSWDAVLDGVLRLAAHTAYLPYVAWDVIATDAGFHVLEGNKFSALNVIQVHEPLLLNPRVRDFFAHHGIL